MNPETFGFEPDENGQINFITIQCEYEVHCFAEYMEWFMALVKVADDNRGFMPIVTFPDYKHGE